MEIKVVKKNKKYANYLKECYCGPSSDFITFLLFKYEYIFFNKTDNNLSINMNRLSNDSLLHFEIFGKLISLLGEKTNIKINNNIDKLFLTDKTKLIEMSIRLTKQKIILYAKYLDLIEDFYIEDILKKFIIEERKNLKILEILQLKNKITKV